MFLMTSAKLIAGKEFATKYPRAVYQESTFGKIALRGQKTGRANMVI